MNKKRRFYRIHLACMVLAIATLLAVILPESVHAGQLTFYDKLNPHRLTIGSESDYARASEQIYETDGTGLIPVTVSTDSTLYLKLYTGKQGAHSIQFFRSPDASGLPEFAGCITQAVIDPMYYGETFCRLEAGTWYMRLPADRYRITSYLYPQGTISAKSGVWTSVYCDYTHPTYISFRATDNGYITVKDENLVETGSYALVTLCNSKGKELVNTISSYLPKDQFVYAVKKNMTYKIRVCSTNNGQMEFCRIRYDFKKYTEKSGTSRNKSVQIKSGSSASGMVFAEDSIGKEDWYKIVVPSNKHKTLTLTGKISSGCICAEVFQSSGKNPKKSLIISRGNETKSCVLKGGKTYYIRITKSEKKACGVYTLK